MIYPNFNYPISNLKLNDNKVHAWKASLDQPASIFQMLEQKLSELKIHKQMNLKNIVFLYLV